MTTTTAPRCATASARSSYHPTRAEQETVLRWDREDPLVHVWSASPVVWRKLERVGIAPGRETRSYGRVSGRFYRIPLRQFRWGLRRAARPGQNPPPRRQEPRVAGSSDTSDGPTLVRARTGAHRPRDAGRPV
jgi:hypothetical protein